MQRRQINRSQHLFGVTLPIIGEYPRWLYHRHLVTLISRCQAKIYSKIMAKITPRSDRERSRIQNLDPGARRRKGVHCTVACREAATNDLLKCG